MATIDFLLIPEAYSQAGGKPQIVGLLDRLYPPTTPFTLQSLTYLVRIRIPAAELGQPIAWEIDLLDEAERSLMPGGKPRPARLDLTPNPAMQTTEDQTMMPAVKLPPVTLPQYGKYVLVARMEGTEVARYAFQACMPPTGIVTPGALPN